jgi:hypothetical protein
MSSETKFPAPPFDRELMPLLRRGSFRRQWTSRVWSAHGRLQSCRRSTTCSRPTALSTRTGGFPGSDRIPKSPSPSSGSGPAISRQALIYPAADATDKMRPKAGLNSPFLSGEDMAAYKRLYLGPDGDPAHRWVSPLLVADHTGLPPALVQVAEHDPLRAAGVPVRFTEYIAMSHGFVNFPGLTRSDRALGARPGPGRGASPVVRTDSRSRQSLSARPFHSSVRQQTMRGSPAVHLSLRRP